MYYSRMSNGWTVILTIPFQEILMGDRNVAIYVVTAIGIFLFILMAAMVLRDLLQSRRIRRASNTIHILTDSFYAIYRVNFRSGTYEAIKTSQDLVGALRRAVTSPSFWRRCRAWWSPPPIRNSP